jgi:hypothetical protein
VDAKRSAFGEAAGREDFDSAAARALGKRTFLAAVQADFGFASGFFRDPSGSAHIE